MLERMLPHIVPGLIYGIGALGLALTFRYLKFPDFTVIGSIMLGGIVCVYATNHFNPIVGLLSSIAIGFILGATTAFLACQIQIPKVLAGIITLTGSYSIGYLIATHGNIILSGPSIISPVFTLKDLLFILFVAILLVSFIAFIMKTKFGSLLFAMSANKSFLKHRHKERRKVFFITLVAGNGIVAFAGALYAFKDQSAYVISHSDFLPYALGAIFSGNAIVKWGSRKLSEHRKGNPHSVNGKNVPNSVFLSIISAERDETSKIGILFFAYVIGCVFFKEISGLVHSNAFKDIIEIPNNFQYLIIAILIAVFVWWASDGEEV